jgi:hypothetical protein
MPWLGVRRPRRQKPQRHKDQDEKKGHLTQASLAHGDKWPEFSAIVRQLAKRFEQGASRSIDI